MKLSENFELEEFVSRATFKKWGSRSIYFLDPKIPKLAQFYKDYFLDYYKKQDSNVGNVYIVINTWANGGTYQARGYRPPYQYLRGQFKKTPESESQHRFGRAFDCDIYIKYKDGTKKEADYREIQKIILADKEIFMAEGLTTLEHPDFARTWLHSDVRWTGLDQIKIVSP